MEDSLGLSEHRSSAPAVCCLGESHNIHNITHNSRILAPLPPSPAAAAAAAAALPSHVPPPLHLTTALHTHQDMSAETASSSASSAPSAAAANTTSLEPAVARLYEIAVELASLQSVVTMELGNVQSLRACVNGVNTSLLLLLDSPAPPTPSYDLPSANIFTATTTVEPPSPMRNSQSFPIYQRPAHDESLCDDIDVVDDDDTDPVDVADHGILNTEIATFEDKINRRIAQQLWLRNEFDSIFDKELSMMSSESLPNDLNDLASRARRYPLLDSWLCLVNLPEEQTEKLRQTIPSLQVLIFQIPPGNLEDSMLFDHKFSRATCDQVLQATERLRALTGILLSKKPSMVARTRNKLPLTRTSKKQVTFTSPKARLTPVLRRQAGIQSCHISSSSQDVMSFDDSESNLSVTPTASNIPSVPASTSVSNGDILLESEQDDSQQQHHHHALHSMHENPSVENTLLPNKRISHAIQHRFSVRTFMLPTPCDYCHRTVVFGVICKECMKKYHAKCAEAVPPSCGLSSEMENVFKQMLISHNFPSTHSSVGSVDITATTSSPEGENSPFRETDHLSQSASPTSSVSFNERAAKAAHLANLHSVESDNPPGFDIGYVSRRRSSSNPPQLAEAVIQPHHTTTTAIFEDEFSGHDFKRNSSFAEWEIPYSELEFGEKIGDTDFGVVFKGKWHGDVAIKKLNVQADFPLEQRLAFRQEVNILRRIRHEHIVLFMGACTRSNFCIVTKFCKGPTLYNHIHILQTKLKIGHCVEILRQVAQGMEYLHAKKIIHRNLKTKNIFLESNGKLCIGDFGFATLRSTFRPVDEIDGLDAEYARKDSIRHLSPELLSNTGQPTMQSDVYSYGVVMYEVLSSSLLFAGEDRQQMITLVCNGSVPDRNTIRKDCPPTLCDFMLKCLALRPSERPTFAAILEKLLLYPKNHLNFSTARTPVRRYATEY